KKLQDLDKRKEAVLKSIEEQQKLTPELKNKINAAESISQVEDIYLPYKPKRKTKASMAREKGLQPLADLLLAQNTNDIAIASALYIDTEKGVNNEEEALAGARDILAELFAEDA